jgi:DNA adenine methylase
MKSLTEATGSINASAASPFVKWAGGKRSVVPEILPWVPREFGRYFEPFVGGGALFFALQPKRACLSDNNPRLVRTYLAVRNEVDALIEGLKQCRYEKEFYYEMRKRRIDEAQTHAEVGIWLIYLNRVGFNGLYRVNSRNEFNVPFGRYTNPTICHENALRACSQALKGAEVRHAPFEDVLDRAEAGDFVYFDPPYVPLDATSYFTGYTEGGFGDDAQIRLRDVALELKRRRVHVVLSNSSAPRVRELYSQGFEIREVLVRRNINSNAQHRSAIPELLIR